MPLNSTGRYHWTRSQLRHHRPSRLRTTLLIIAFWVAIGVAHAQILLRVTGGAQ